MKTLKKKIVSGALIMGVILFGWQISPAEMPSAAPPVTTLPSVPDDPPNLPSDPTIPENLPSLPSDPTVPENLPPLPSDPTVPPISPNPEDKPQIPSDTSFPETTPQVPSEGSLPGLPQAPSEPVTSGTLEQKYLPVLQKSVDAGQGIRVGQEMIPVQGLFQDIDPPDLSGDMKKQLVHFPVEGLAEGGIRVRAGVMSDVVIIPKDLGIGGMAQDITPPAMSGGFHEGTPWPEVSTLFGGGDAGMVVAPKITPGDSSGSIEVITSEIVKEDAPGKIFMPEMYEHFNQMEEILKAGRKAIEEKYGPLTEETVATPPDSPPRSYGESKEWVEMRGKLENSLEQLRHVRKVIDEKLETIRQEIALVNQRRDQLAEEAGKWASGARESFVDDTTGLAVDTVGNIAGGKAVDKISGAIGKGGKQIVDEVGDRVVDAAKGNVVSLAKNVRDTSGQPWLETVVETVGEISKTLSGLSLLEYVGETMDKYEIARRLTRRIDNHDWVSQEMRRDQQRMEKYRDQLDDQEEKLNKAALEADRKTFAEDEEERREAFETFEAVNSETEKMTDPANIAGRYRVLTPDGRYRGDVYISETYWFDDDDEEEEED
jgi:hypothetical protein